MRNIERHVVKDAVAAIFCEVIMASFRLLGLIPRTWAARMGNGLGQLFFYIDKRHREIALNNLKLAFGHEETPDQIQQLARKVFRNLGRILFEIGWALRLNPEDFSRYFSIRHLSRLEAAYQKGKGVLILTGHMGNWELLTVIGRMIGYPTSIVFRPLDFAPLNRFFERFRGRFGARLIPSQWAMAGILRSLKRGELVAVLLDQNVDWYQGVFVDFFKTPACTNKGLALLAMKSGAPVVQMFLVRDGDRFRAEIGQEIPLVRTGDQIKDVEANT
ncbi:MAG: lauroyl acyltransferase, partial [Deltaproteobacteria bacterium]|nr:lauroyl acyltransferase [Deltaproteobacteria bacterium]